MKGNNDEKCYGFCGDVSVKMILSAVALFLIFFLATKTAKDIKSYDYIGKDISAVNTITASGKGEIVAKADIASFTFSVIEESKDVSEAQDRAAKKVNAMIKFLKENGIDEKDVKTINYNISPRYDYIRISDKTMNPLPITRERDNRVLVGYEINQGIEVKVRNIGSAGNILSGIGGLGVNDVSGLSFSIDEQDKLAKDARGLAIKDAKDNAKVLADSLGVKLVRIVNFSESGYFPIYREKFSVSTMPMGAGGDTAPEIPSGENKITSQVNIVYEIR